MSAYFRADYRTKALSLYFEDDKIAMNVWDDRPPFLGEEILLEMDSIQPLIDALTQMRATIKERFPA